MGFCSVTRWMISNACWTMRTAMIFLPLLRPFIIRLEWASAWPKHKDHEDMDGRWEKGGKKRSTHALTRRSTIGMRPLANCFLA